mmetsp:Transcript_83840/g.211447  ORF Transcript_83840/g.211447 Transcript_83840/m.211447 type:complete len:278 (+) Transcript_83840:133-966(+)
MMSYRRKPTPATSQQTRPVELGCATHLSLAGAELSIVSSACTELPLILLPDSSTSNCFASTFHGALSFNSTIPWCICNERLSFVRRSLPLKVRTASPELPQSGAASQSLLPCDDESGPFAACKVWSISLSSATCWPFAVTSSCGGTTFGNSRSGCTSAKWKDNWHTLEPPSLLGRLPPSLDPLLLAGSCSSASLLCASQNLNLSSPSKVQTLLGQRERVGEDSEAAPISDWAIWGLHCSNSNCSARTSRSCAASLRSKSSRSNLCTSANDEDEESWG